MHGCDLESLRIYVADGIVCPVVGVSEMAVHLLMLLGHKSGGVALNASGAFEAAPFSCT
jgi:hypothetical protein